MKKISIYILSFGYGGAERAITNIANILCKNNNVTIKSIYNIQPFFKLNTKVKVEYLANIRPNREEFKSAVKNKKIIKAFIEGLKAIKILYLKKKVIIQSLKKENANIVITTRKEHNYYNAKYTPSGITTIGQEHNDFYNNKDIKKVIKGAKYLDYFMPASKFLADKYGFLKSKYKVVVVYIPHSITEYKLTNIKKENQIISVGRLEPVKGVDDTIKMFEILNKTNRNIKLKIIGTGSEENKLKKISSNENIIFLGKMEYNNLQKEYEKSLLLISTSHSESFGLVALEAANAGVPTVCFDSANGLKEIIKNNESGIIIPNRDIELMASEINNLLKDNNKLKLFSNNAKNYSKNFYEKEIESKWKKFLENIE